MKTAKTVKETFRDIVKELSKQFPMDNLEAKIDKIGAIVIDWNSKKPLEILPKLDLFKNLK